MPVFIAVPLVDDSANLDKAVTNTVESSSRYKLPSNRGWLISFEGTTVELCNHIGLTGQPAGVHSPVGSAIVSPISAYYGRGSSDMWEWLKTRFEQ